MAGQMMLKRMRLLLDRISPWRRGFSEGWDCGVAEGLHLIEHMLERRDEPLITRTDLEDAAHRLRRELVR